MKYPKALIKQVQQRCQGMKLEGLNEGAGPLTPVLMIVGEAPGREELQSQIPFHGASGQELMKSLASIGLTREDVYITSVVRSRPYAVRKVFSKRENKMVIKHPNRKPTKKEILAQAPLFAYELERVKTKLIVPVGETALQTLLGARHQIATDHGRIIGPIKIKKLNKAEKGYIWTSKKYILIPQYHPAAVFYNRKLTGQIARDWLTVKSYLEKSNFYE